VGGLHEGLRYHEVHCMAVGHLRFRNSVASYVGAVLVVGGFRIAVGRWGGIWHVIYWGVGVS